MTRAKLFMLSQAVRLAAEFRFGLTKSKFDEIQKGMKTDLRLSTHGGYQKLTRACSPSANQSGTFKGASALLSPVSLALSAALALSRAPCALCAIPRAQPESER